MDNPGQTDQNDLELLIESISNDHCALFIGAGLSMPVGYPGLPQLLKDMAEVAELEQIREKEIADGWKDDFQYIKEVLGVDQYQDCLWEIFDHRARNLEFNPILLNLLKIPFCAYITTNYDPCIEFASRQHPFSLPPYKFVYPNLPVTELKNRHIFHVHGYIDPENKESVNTVVLSRNEYIDAYEKSGIVSNFLHSLFTDLDVLFIGFGWSDPVIIDIIRNVKEAREVREDIAIQRNFRLSRKRNKYSIIDIDTYTKDRETNNYLGMNGVRPIIYEKTAGSHNPLNGIVQLIQEKTLKIPLVPLPSTPNDFLAVGDKNE